MNTRQPIQPSNISNVLSLSYSSSGKRFIAGLADGIRVFRTDNCLTTYHPDSLLGIGTHIAEALDDRFIAYVYSHKLDGGGPSVVVFWDTLLELELSRFDFHEPILGLKLSSRWLAVVLEERTILLQYQELQRPVLPKLHTENDDSDHESETSKQQSLRAPNLVHSLHSTAINPFALAALSGDLLALPAQSVGQVQLLSLKHGASSTKRVLRAHNSSLHCLALSNDGSLLSTASEQGTLIRVFNTKTLDQIAEHRRGMDAAIIKSLAFSPGNRWIASTSDKSTLHVFDLRPPSPADVAHRERDREQRQYQKSRAQMHADNRLSGANFDRDSISGMSVGRSSPAPSTAIGAGPGTAYHGSVQEYYGLRPPPASASPPAREAAVTAMAALKASPFAPRIFKDSRSVASAPFYTGNDPPHWQGGPAYSWTTAPSGARKRVKNPILPLPNDPYGRPPKGILACSARGSESSDDDGTIIYVVGGGSDARWEMFELLPATSAGGDVTGGWVLVNRGFRKYLTRQFTD